MRIRHFIFALTLAPLALSSQDLVKNASFDVQGAQPTGWSQIDRTEGWSNGNGGTVDLYSTGAGKCAKNVAVPTNHQGDQTPFDGDSYAGIIAYQDDKVVSIWPDLWENQEIGTKPGYQMYSEYITTELNAPLVAGKAYRITYQVSLSERSTRAISNLGGYASVEHPNQLSNAFMKVKPSFTMGQVVDNQSGWVPVTGTFTAKGGEKFLTIGVFNHKKMEVKKIGETNAPDYKRAYYYVDGISMLPAEGIDFNSILTGSNVILTKLNFDSGKSTIRSESFPQLDKFAEWLKDHSEIGVSIDGHTDKQGSDELNLQLSKNRADAVKKYLMDKGVKGDKLFTRGFGETQPLDKGSGENNEKNRRVEISLRK